MKNNERISYWVFKFLNEELPKNCNASINTRQSYRDTLKLFCNFIFVHKKIKLHKIVIANITVQIIRDFLDQIEMKTSVITRNHRLACLRSFFNFIARESPEFIELSAQISFIKKKPIPVKEKDYLEYKEFDALLNVINKTTKTGNRNFILLNFLCKTGARASEVAGLKIKDLLLDSDIPIVNLFGKGRKNRTCPLPKDLVFMLKNLTSTAKGLNSPVFQSSRGNEEPLSRTGIYQIVKSIFHEAQKNMPSLSRKNISPHSLRHTFATYMIRAGNDLNIVREDLGHVSLNTTIKYLGTDLEMKSKGVEKCSLASEYEEPEWDEDFFKLT